VRVSEAAISAHDIATRFWRDRRGAVAVAVAVLLPVLIGFAGIGIEVGLWFAVQRQNQSAADAAAISAALEYAAQIESGVPTDPTAAATTTANYNLFSTTSPNTLTLYPCYGFTITVGSSCNTSSSSGALPNAVQVVLTQPLNTTFANLVTAIWGPSVNTVNVTTTAIAAFSQPSPACLLAGDTVLVDNATLSNRNCWVAANSSSGSALNCNNCTIAGPTTVVGGDAVSNNGHLGSPNRTYASAIADPYAASLTHAFLTTGMAKSSNCNPKITQTNYVFFPGAYCIIPGGSSFSGTINLSPGTYWVTDGSLQLSGTLACPSCSPGGSGVTIIFTTTKGSAGTIGTLSPSGPLTITLNAPGPGMAYAGLLMVQDPVAGVTPTAGGPIGSPSTTLSGLLYFPNTSLNFTGNIRTDTSNCLVAVASSFSVTGNISLDGSGCQSAGLTTVPTILPVFLAV
jgi:Flp pilus assembly protein TadG